MTTCRWKQKDKNVTFIHIPKSGGTSIYKQIGGTPKTITVKVDNRYKTDKHADLYKMRKELGELGFTFTVVRNPWDRMVSAYHYYKRAGHRPPADFPKNFNQYILNYDWSTIAKPQSDYFDVVDYILRFENLGEDFVRMCKVHGIKTKGAGLPRVNRSFHKHYSEYYTDAAMMKVQKEFSKDIRRFGYQYEEDRLSLQRA